MTGHKRNIGDLQGEIQELFADLWQVPGFAGLRRGFRPQSDCFRTDDPPTLHVIIELPGVDPGSVEVVAAKAFGLQAVDGPYAVIDDADGLRASAERALALGCDGKWVIHPDQIAPVTAAFTPSADEVERERRILDAADGASSVDGAMVDAASKRLAASVISRAGPSAP